MNFCMKNSIIFGVVKIQISLKVKFTKKLTFWTKIQLLE